MLKLFNFFVFEWTKNVIYSIHKDQLALQQQLVNSGDGVQLPQ